MHPSGYVPIGQLLHGLWTVGGIQSELPREAHTEHANSGPSPTHRMNF